MTFSRRASTPPHRPFHPGLAKAFGWGYVGVVSLQNHWWQTEDMGPAMAAVQSVLREDVALTTYGTSMGGAGAILASQFIDIERCVAAAPPLIIDQGYSPWEERFQDSWEGLTLLHVPDFAQRQPQKTFVIYDPFLDLDLQHVTKMADEGLRVTRLPAPFMGHIPLSEIALAELYPQFTEALVINGDEAMARSIIKQTRNARGVFDYNMLMRGKDLLDPAFDNDDHIGKLEELIRRHGPHDYLREARAEMMYKTARYAAALEDYEELFARTKRRKFERMSIKSRIMVEREAAQRAAEAEVASVGDHAPKE